MADKDIEALVDEVTQVGQLRRDLEVEREKSKRLAADLGDLRRAMDLADAVQGANPKPPTWVAKKPKKRHQATLCLFVTDTHLDEVVNPDEVGDLNAYDREIAGQRLERAFTGAVKFARDYVNFDIRGAVVFWGGDIISGDIHGELARTNQATTQKTLLHWIEPLAAGVDLLAREFGTVHNVGVPGNHGRQTKKPVYKQRAATNWDTFLYELVAMQHKDRGEITWQVPESLWADVEVQGVHIRLEHGDEGKGGSGISAAMSPLLLLQHRRARQYAEAGRPLDLLMVGHFHSRYSAPGLLAGGTMKGPDEYATGKGFTPAPASQEVILIGDQGIILNAPIWVTDRKAEGW